MATTTYQPDPYMGWSNINPVSNVTAYEIFNDTSGRWQLTADFGVLRTYRAGW